MFFLRFFPHSTYVSLLRATIMEEKRSYDVVNNLFFFLSYNVKICLHPTSITPIHLCVPFMRQTIIHIFTLSVIFTVNFSRNRRFPWLTSFGWVCQIRGSLSEHNVKDLLMADRPITSSDNFCRSLFFFFFIPVLVAHRCQSPHNPHGWGMICAQWALLNYSPSI